MFPSEGPSWNPHAEVTPSSPKPGLCGFVIFCSEYDLDGTAQFPIASKEQDCSVHLIISLYLLNT